MPSYVGLFLPSCAMHYTYGIGGDSQVMLRFTFWRLYLYPKTDNSPSWKVCCFHILSKQYLHGVQLRWPQGHFFIEDCYPPFPSWSFLILLSVSSHSTPGLTLVNPVLKSVLNPLVLNLDIQRMI